MGARIGIKREEESLVFKNLEIEEQKQIEKYNTIKKIKNLCNTKIKNPEISKIRNKNTEIVGR